MSTTSLFVELIVIGVGAALWVGLLIISVFGYDDAVMKTLASPVATVVLLSVIYLLGIVTDRIADLIFDKRWGSAIRKQWFDSVEDYYRARSDIFEKSQLASELLEYSRSRLRICRGWAFNSVISAVALTIFLFTPSYPTLDKPRLFAFGTLGLLLLALGAWYSWKKLAESEYRRVHEYAKTSVEQAKNPSRP